MKILKLEIEGYRSLKSQTWCPGDLNVLIGPNASGKSNLLRVLETLSSAAQGKLGGTCSRKVEWSPSYGMAEWPDSHQCQDDPPSPLFRSRDGRPYVLA